MNTLVLYDFDNTITTKDTFPLFFKFTFGWFKFYLVFFLLTPLFIIFKLKLISAEKFKTLILSVFLNGKEKEWINEKSKLFIDFLYKENVIKKEFIDQINQYKHSKATLSIVSASPNIWLNVFCNQLEIDCICTELLFENSIYTGKLATKNCNGEEKKKRVLQKYLTADFNEIIVYGDSKGDNAMMELATIKKWVK